MLLGVVIFVAGVFAWTLLEYVIHGVLGHAHRTFVTVMHDVHHRDPHAVFALGAWIPIAVVMLGGWYLFGVAPAMIFLGGIVAGFAAYEIIHYRMHFTKPAVSIEASLRARHLAHHFREPDRIFGVTTPLWDHVFGSAPTSDQMRTLREAGTRIAPLGGRSNLGRIIHAASASIRSRITAS